MKIDEIDENLDEKFHLLRAGTLSFSSSFSSLYSAPGDRPDKAFECVEKFGLGGFDIDEPKFAVVIFFHGLKKKRFSVRGKNRAVELCQAVAKRFCVVAVQVASKPRTGGVAEKNSVGVRENDGVRAGSDLN